MFFSDFRCFKILDVYRVSRQAGVSINKGRSWTAIAFRISGESMFKVGAKLLSANAGSMIYIPSGLDYSRETENEELIVIHLKCYENEDDTIEILSSNNYSLTLKEMCDIYDEWINKKPGYEYQCTAMLYTMLRRLRLNNDLLSHRTAIIKPGIELIDSNFDNPQISVEQAAKACNISAEYFRKLYKGLYNISPHEAIIKKRLEKACMLLQSGYFTVGEVAEHSGFRDCKYFGTLFRKKIGITPGDYMASYND